MLQYIFPFQYPRGGCFSVTYTVYEIATKRLRFSSFWSLMFFQIITLKPQLTCMCKPQMAAYTITLIILVICDTLILYVQYVTAYIDKNLVMILKCTLTQQGWWLLMECWLQHMRTWPVHQVLSDHYCVYWTPESEPPYLDQRSQQQRANLSKFEQKATWWMPDPAE